MSELKSSLKLKKNIYSDGFNFPTLTFKCSMCSLSNISEPSCFLPPWSSPPSSFTWVNAVASLLTFWLPYSLLITSSQQSRQSDAMKYVFSPATPQPTPPNGFSFPSEEKKLRPYNGPSPVLSDPSLPLYLISYYSLLSHLALAIVTFLLFLTRHPPTWSSVFVFVFSTSAVLSAWNIPAPDTHTPCFLTSFKKITQGLKKKYLKWLQVTISSAHIGLGIVPASNSQTGKPHNSLKNWIEDKEGFYLNSEEYLALDWGQPPSCLTNLKSKAWKSQTVFK